MQLPQLREHPRRHLDQTLERCAQSCTAAQPFPPLKCRSDEPMAIGETPVPIAYLTTERLPVRAPACLVRFDDVFEETKSGNSIRPVNRH